MIAGQSAGGDETTERLQEVSETAETTERGTETSVYGQLPLFS
jgi:hypothetical protein